MYTNELLEEKYKAQRKLAKQSEKQNKEYQVFIEEEVRSIFKKNGWKFDYSKRKGGFLGSKLPHPA